MLFWKKIPSLWIGQKISVFQKFEIAHAIAAIKIYISFCLFCKENDDGIRTVALTYTEICRIASLSRSLVSEGLKILYSEELIRNLSVTPRKKLYTVDVEGVLKDGWAKLPFSGIVSNDRTITAFQSMHNRYYFELIALQLYLYLLYARDNNNEYTLARKATITSKLKCSTAELNKAITYLIHIGLLKTVRQKSVEDYPSEIFHDSFYFYMTSAGKNALTYRKSPIIKVSDEDLPF
ncbi:hypothetical protein AAGW04_22040 [Pectobacterium aroidearum]|uniref:MarR family transcriptional regulator n=1 Tax=Pectobacterium polaris TaxID=2042057 RepID=A0AAW4P6L0_9GAMM|nr:hypothetical protein [Pectobacterium polaris]MBW5894641.1 hypothetical protein [Pectobacterium polaris]